MTELTTYDYYKNSFGGTLIPQELFKRFDIKATSRINNFTSSRIKSLTNDIQNACCEIMELLYSQEKLIEKVNDDTSIVASETVGPHSKNYVNKTSLQNQRILSEIELKKECYSICYNYLADTGLMYRGV